MFGDYPCCSADVEKAEMVVCHLLDIQQIRVQFPPDTCTPIFGYRFMRREENFEVTLSRFAEGSANRVARNLVGLRYQNTLYLRVADMRPVISGYCTTFARR